MSARQETILGLRALRQWLDLSQSEASKDAGVCDRTIKMWEYHGLTTHALSPPSEDGQSPIALLAEAWGVPEEILQEQAPDVDYRRLRAFVDANGGIETVFKALEFVRRVEDPAPPE